jgi:hypothetical protein
VLLVVIGIVTLLLMGWPMLRPSETSQAPFTGDGMVKGWTPIIVLASAITLSAVSLLIVAVRRWRSRSLAADVSRLSKELAAEKATLVTVNQDREALKRDLSEADKRTNEQRNQKRRHSYGTKKT